MSPETSSTTAEAPPKLSKRTVLGPTPRDCCSFEWGVQWELDKPTTKGGFVVQKVELPYDVKDCAGNKADPAVVGGIQPSWYPFWEPWPIAKGSQITTYAQTGDVQDDTYFATGHSQPTKGTVTVKGTANFYEMPALPSSFRFKNDAGGQLPIAKTDPKLTGGTGAVQHDLKASWYCCEPYDPAARRTKIEIV